MNNKTDLPKIIPVFPLSNFIFFPNSSIPLNIFEKRYIQMVDESMKKDRVIGMIQPKKTLKDKVPNLYSVGSLGKITSFKETEDGRYMITLDGVSRFRVLNEIENSKLYRECEVKYDEFKEDLITNKSDKTHENLSIIFENLKLLFKKQGYMIDWDNLKNQSFDKTINTISMASPFSLEEKQVLLEANNLINRKEKLEQILSTYLTDHSDNTTVQ
tara:strand:- start:1287 stop:1931 length:645 start_codon:yes stop_codon:yes gene_type:complete